MSDAANQVPEQWRPKAVALAPWPLILGAVFVVCTQVWLPFWGTSIRANVVYVAFTLLGLALCGRGVRQLWHANRAVGRAGVASGETGADGLRSSGTTWWWRRAPRMQLSWGMGALCVVVGVGLWLFADVRAEQVLAFVGTGGMIASGYSGMSLAARYSRLCRDFNVPFPALF
ncbi:hypothetical protein [Gulosibacter sediminis]|uniref:hypothetical protein n=1 Tax=Gulosibacter sediminis TaxID=1729695 RepID=UPI0024A95AC6|nr:hypothetical protein [Gulosibacter sediminis]